MLLISPLEFLAIALFAIPALVWCVMHGVRGTDVGETDVPGIDVRGIDVRGTWAVAVMASVAIAALLTPADLLSTILFASLFLVMFAAGWRTSRLSATKTT